MLMDADGDEEMKLMTMMKQPMKSCQRRGDMMGCNMDASAAYVTRATAGTLEGQDGIDTYSLRSANNIGEEREGGVLTWCGRGPDGSAHQLALVAAEYSPDLGPGETDGPAIGHELYLRGVHAGGSSDECEWRPVWRDVKPLPSGAAPGCARPGG